MKEKYDVERYEVDKTFVVGRDFFKRLSNFYVQKRFKYLGSLKLGFYAVFREDEGYSDLSMNLETFQELLDEGYIFKEEF